MANEPVCAQCGAPLPANAPGNRCPKCMFQLGLEETDDDAQSEQAGAGCFSVAAPDTHPESDSTVERPGTMLGRYKLLQQIGEGGFGIVFMAEQTEPVHRTVALKVIKAGMDSREIIARFESERQALALMDHPNIARVLDGGATANRRPYFVMELVKGIPMTEYCDQASLSTRERLELFIKVCRAVQHAHQKGVIHRDLKPNNVLVTLHDGEPVPKVIDFGVAKALGRKLTEKTLFTRFEQMVGTPAYMSPEQAALGGLDIDTRSDIYSLGVLLYELLTGVTPLDAETLRQGALDEIRRMIRETDPPKPSTRLQTLGKRLAEVAQCRHSEPAALGRLVRGDLDWITMKCLEKDRTRRYETVNGLARDIERHLDNEPVVARPPSWLYEFQKAVRRHKFGFGATAAVIATLSLGVLVSTQEAVRARRAERAAQDSKRDATEKLWGSYLAEARARRRSGEAGQRFASLAALSNAAAIRPSLELRSEAIASLALPDVRLLPEAEKRFTRHLNFVNHDARFERYAVGDTNGAVTIRRRSDDKELLRLPPEGGPGLASQMFSPDGKLLAVRYRDRVTRLWDLDSGQLLWQHPSLDELDFSRQGTVMAVIQSNSIAVYDLTNFQKLSVLTLGGVLDTVRFSPDARLLSCFVNDTNALVVDIQTGKTVLSLANPEGFTLATWHPGGKLLATACGDNLIYLWDVLSGNALRKLEGHKGSPVSLDFSHNGKLLLSGGYDSWMRLWDVQSGRQLLSCFDAATFTFGPDDTEVAALGWDGDQLRFYEFADGHEASAIYERGRVAGPPIGQAHFSANGRWLAYDTDNGTVLYDVQAQRQAGSLKESVALWGFAPEDRAMLGASPCGNSEWRVSRWTVPEGTGGKANMEPALKLGGKALGWAGCVSPDGTLCVAIGEGLAQVFRTDTLNEVARTDVQRGMRYAAVSPDSSLLATGAFHARGVKVWDAHSGKLVKALPSEEITIVTFSPDGHWLVAGGLGSQFWEVGTWSAGLHLTNSFSWASAFSHDGKILAASSLFTKVGLYNSATGEKLAELEPQAPWQVTCLDFSPDGTQLAVCEGHNALRVWDLRAIRRRLAQMRLDWNMPPYPPTVASALANPP